VKRKIWTFTRLISVSLLMLVAVMVGGVLSYRGFRQHVSQSAMTIDSANGIDEGMFVRIGGTEQWVTIRGRNRANPVLMMIHGGPGVSNGAFAIELLRYEEDYTVVQWDQPGTAKSFGRAGNRIDSGLTIADVAQDGIDLADFLKAHLYKRKLIVLGWSWGSIVGVEMVRKRPDLFAAYIGTGQIVNEQKGEAISYAAVLRRARERGDQEAIRELESGPPPYTNQGALANQRKWSSIYEGDSTPVVQIARSVFLAPRYSLWDAWSYLSGVVASQNHFLGAAMDGEFMKVDLMAGDAVFALPIIVIQGADDAWTPAELSRAFVATITAPVKEFIPIAGAGHKALVKNASAFLTIMNSRVRPIVLTQTADRH
jgi:pimeloyl-ACP methyl ester carboxylesterase